MINKQKQKVICIGSMGRDIFFPTNSGNLEKDLKIGGKGKKWIFGYGEKIHVDDKFQAPGGCACNVSVGLSRLGIKASAYGVVGQDSDGNWIKNELEREKVCVDLVEVRKKSSSDISCILVREDDGDRIIFANRDVGESLHLNYQKIKGYDWLFVGSLYGEDRICNMSVIHDVVVKENVKLAFNPGMSNIKEDTRKVFDLLYHTSILFVNKKEAQEILKRRKKIDINDTNILSEVDLLRELDKLISLKESLIVLTYGDKGAWVLTENKSIIHVSSLGGSAKDTTGAGDAFASGFLASKLLGNSIEKSMQWGASNSYSVINEYGAHKGLLDIRRIRSNYSKFLLKVVV